MDFLNEHSIFDKRTSENLCKKVLKICDESSLFTNAKNAMKEFETLYTIKHPCICRAIGINTSEPISDDEKENTTIALYLEFLSRNLKECIDKNILDNTLKVRIAIEIAHALNFIHKHGMIHRDIKIENIMMNSIFESKIVDFGLVRIDECVNGESFVQTSMTKGIGTLSYMSPEMINEENYDSKTDVYSYGIVLHYLFIGKLPVYSIKDKVNGKQIPLPKPSSSITEFGIKMITKCTNHTPSKRPSFDEILNDIRANSFLLAPGIDKALIVRRDRELSFFESQKP